EAPELRWVEALGSGAAGDQIDCTNVLSHLSHWHACQKKLQLLGGVAGAQAYCAQAILVEREMHGRHALAPVRGDSPHARTLEHDLANLPGNGAHLRDIWPHDAERDWER